MDFDWWQKISLSFLFDVIINQIQSRHKELSLCYHILYLMENSIIQSSSIKKTFCIFGMLKKLVRGCLAAKIVVPNPINCSSEYHCKVEYSVRLVAASRSETTFFRVALFRMTCTWKWVMISCLLIASKSLSAFFLRNDARLTRFEFNCCGFSALVWARASANSSDVGLVLLMAAFLSAGGMTKAVHERPQTGDSRASLIEPKCLRGDWADSLYGLIDSWKQFPLSSLLKIIKKTPPKRNNEIMHYFIICPIIWYQKKKKT